MHLNLQTLVLISKLFAPLLNIILETIIDYVATKELGVFGEETVGGLFQNSKTQHANVINFLVQLGVGTI